MRKILLHACCAPCSSSVLERLGEYDVTAYFYNPNIRPLAEYERRLTEMRLLDVKTIEGPQDFDEWDKVALEFHFGEGGRRCGVCFYKRLLETAKYAKKIGIDIFATTLTVSPHKNANVINMIGEKVAIEVGIEYLSSDFKKQGGFQRSLEISKQLGMYRQNYCGCTPRVD